MSYFAFFKVGNPESAISPGYGRGSGLRGSGLGGSGLGGSGLGGSGLGGSGLGDTTSYYETVTDADDKKDMSEDAKLAQQLQQEEIAQRGMLTSRRGVKTFPKWNWIPTSAMTGNVDSNLEFEKDIQLKMSYKNSPSLVEDGAKSESRTLPFQHEITGGGQGQVNICDTSERADKMKIRSSDGLHTAELNSSIKRKGIEQNPKRAAFMGDNSPKSVTLQNDNTTSDINNMPNGSKEPDSIQDEDIEYSDSDNSPVKKQGDSRNIRVQGDSRNIGVQGDDGDPVGRHDYTQVNKMTENTRKAEQNSPPESDGMVVTTLKDCLKKKRDREFGDSSMDGRESCGSDKHSSDRRKTGMAPLSIGNSINKLDANIFPQVGSLTKVHKQPSNLTDSNILLNDSASTSSPDTGDITLGREISHMETVTHSNENKLAIHSRPIHSLLRGESEHVKRDSTVQPLSNRNQEDTLSRKAELNTTQNQSIKQITGNRSDFQHFNDNENAITNPEIAKPEKRKHLIKISKSRTEFENPREIRQSEEEKSITLASDQNEASVEKDDLQLAMKLQEEEDAHFAQRLQSHSQSSTRYKEQQHSYEEMQNPTQETTQSPMSFTAFIETSDEFLDRIFNYVWPSPLARPTPRPIINKNYDELLQKQFNNFLSKKYSPKGTGRGKVSESFRYSRDYQQQSENDQKGISQNWTAAGNNATDELPPLVYPHQTEVQDNDSDSASNDMDSYRTSSLEQDYYFSPSASLTNLPSKQFTKNGKHLHHKVADNSTHEKKNIHHHSIEQGGDVDSRKQRYSTKEDWLEWQHPVDRETDKNVMTRAPGLADNKQKYGYSGQPAVSDIRYDTMQNPLETEVSSFTHDHSVSDSQNFVKKNIDRTRVQEPVSENNLALKMSASHLEERKVESISSVSKPKKTPRKPQFKDFSTAEISPRKPQSEEFDNTEKSPRKSQSKEFGSTESTSRKPLSEKHGSAKPSANGFMPSFEGQMRMKFIPQRPFQEQMPFVDRTKLRVKTKKNKDLMKQERLGEALNLDDYETCWEVSEMLGDVKTLGLNKEEISNFPSHEYQEGASNMVETECQICLRSFQKGEMIRTLPCLHLFHRKCIDKWLKINAICPVCRVNAKGF